MTSKAPPGAQAVLRAIALLKAFTPEDPERGLASLAAEVSLNRSTAHRLLSALESEGLVTRNPANGRYRLGPETVALGARALRSSNLREAVRPVLETLARETGETATLEVLSRGKMLILDEVLGAHLIGASPSLGTAWALHATSTGKALLAQSSDAAKQRLVPDSLERFTPRTITSRDALEKELEAIRAAGFATAVEELEEGYAAVGAVIPMPLGEPYATISVGGPSARIRGARISQIGELVSDAASALARSFGR